jgi:hypothetical protein
MTSIEGETALRKRRGGGNASWAVANLTGLKNEENSRDRFSL